MSKSKTKEWFWERCYDFNDLKEILLLVEPNIYDAKGLVDRFPKLSRAYVARNALGTKVNAIAVATLLPISKTLHVEDFAIHPRVQKTGVARDAWLSWRKFLAEEWKETQKTGTSMTIEVYLHNVEAWRKIMGVTEIYVGGMKPLFISEKTPIKLMGRDLKVAPWLVYGELQRFQKKWMIQSKL